MQLSEDMQSADVQVMINDLGITLNFEFVVGEPRYFAGIVITTIHTPVEYYDADVSFFDIANESRRNSLTEFLNS